MPEIVDDHGRALARERERLGPSDATSGSGHDGDLALESAAHRRRTVAVSDTRVRCRLCSYEDMDDALATQDAGALAAAIARKEVGSRELLDLYLDRIERLNPPLNAVVTLDVERARAAAAAADEMTSRGESAGPLHGLPITIKDAIEVEGVRSTGGATELTDHVPASDAAAVAQLKAAGRDRVRQDQHPPLVGRPPELQRDLRNDQQSRGT